jgi:IS30 family transposase
MSGRVIARIRREGDFRISHEWICQCVYRDKHEGGLLYRHLRQQKPRKNSIQNAYQKKSHPDLIKQRWTGDV